MARSKTVVVETKGRKFERPKTEASDSVTKTLTLKGPDATPVRSHVPAPPSPGGEERQKISATQGIRRLISADEWEIARRREAEGKRKSIAEAYKKEGRCPAIIKPQDHTRGRGPKPEPYLCGRPGAHIGYCHEHLLRDVAEMDKRKHLFLAEQVPWGRMTDRQLQRLKKGVRHGIGLEDFLSILSEHDPANAPLEPLPRRPKRSGPLPTRRDKKSST